MQYAVQGAALEDTWKFQVVQNVAMWMVISMLWYAHVNTYALVASLLQGAIQGASCYLTWHRHHLLKDCLSPVVSAWPI